MWSSSTPTRRAPSSSASSSGSPFDDASYETRSSVSGSTADLPDVEPGDDDAASAARADDDGEEPLELQRPKAGEVGDRLVGRRDERVEPLIRRRLAQALDAGGRRCSVSASAVMPRTPYADAAAVAG